MFQNLVESLKPEELVPTIIYSLFSSHIRVESGCPHTFGHCSQIHIYLFIYYIYSESNYGGFPPLLHRDTLRTSGASCVR